MVSAGGGYVKAALGRRERSFQRGFVLLPDLAHARSTSQPFAHQAITFHESQGLL